MPLNAETLARYKNGRVFVETGTGPGFGIKAALECGFEKVVSLEFDKAIFEREKAKFAHVPEVTILHADSGRHLPKVIRDIQEPIVFWLDAHGKSADPTPDYSLKPLLAELDAIARHPFRLRHTVLIDDWDMVVSPKHCPHLTEESVRHELHRINPDFRLSRVDGWIIQRKNPYWLVMVAEPLPLPDPLTPEAYWTLRYKMQGEHYVAKGGKEDSYHEQVEALAPVLRELVGGTRVLDFGCGPGRFRAALEDDFREYVGVDLIPGLGTEPLGETLPTGFDTAVAVMVLQHITDPDDYERWVKQLYECLKPGGRLVVVDHNPGDDMEEHMAPRGPEGLTVAPWADWKIQVGSYDDHWIGVFTK